MTADGEQSSARHYTIDEYFALEHAGDARYEFWDGEIVCMSGGSLPHAIISGNLHLCIGRQLEGELCRVFTSDLAVKTSLLPPYRYPDLSAVGDRPHVEYLQGIALLTNPVLVLEVLLPGTESRDRNEKRAAYQAIPTVQECLLVAQSTPHVTHYVKKNAEWLRNDYSDLTGSIELSSIQCRLSLREAYEGVEFT